MSTHQGDKGHSPQRQGTHGGAAVANTAGYYKTTTSSHTEQMSLCGITRTSTAPLAGHIT
jgi:hypothetical protein